MNPNSTIRPWLLACGKQYGIREAHDHRWPDAETRQHEAYIEYRLLSMEPAQEGTQDMTTASTYTAVHKGYQLWRTTVEVVLYNAQDGLYILASCCVAAEHNPNVRQLFDGQCEFRRAISVTDESEIYDDEIRYRHRMLCTFFVNVEHELSESNGVVEKITQSPRGTSPTYEITDSGYTEI